MLNLCICNLDLIFALPKGKQNPGMMTVFICEMLIFEKQFSNGVYYCLLALGSIFNKEILAENDAICRPTAACNA